MPNKTYWTAIFSVDAPAGTQDQEYTFRVPFPCQVMEMYSAADAADGTDYYLAVLKQGTTTLLTGTVVNTADITRVDSADQVYLAPGVDYKVLVDATGTQSNIKGINITIWAVVHR